jgi:hypothetical protein
LPKLPTPHIKVEQPWSNNEWKPPVLRKEEVVLEEKGGKKGGGEEAEDIIHIT